VPDSTGLRVLPTPRSRAPRGFLRCEGTGGRPLADRQPQTIPITYVPAALRRRRTCVPTAACQEVVEPIQRTNEGAPTGLRHADGGIEPSAKVSSAVVSGVAVRMSRRAWVLQFH
jgi:hypothetical protein